MTASVLDPSSTPYKATNDLLTINLNEWFYNCISCNRNVDISFSFGDTTLKIANFCRFYHSKYRPMTKAISWGGGGETQNTLILTTTASTSNNEFLLQYLLSFHNLVIAKAY